MWIDRWREGRGHVQWEGLLGQREEVEERAGRLGVDVSLATGLDTWAGRRELLLSQEGQHALPSSAQPQGAPFPVRQEMPRVFETFAPLPCLSSPRFSRVSLPSWGTPLAGEAEGLGWGLPLFILAPALVSAPLSPGEEMGGPPSGPNKLLPATRPKQACGRPQLPYLASSLLKRVTQRVGHTGPRAHPAP